MERRGEKKREWERETGRAGERTKGRGERVIRRRGREERREVERRE